MCKCVVVLEHGWPLCPETPDAGFSIPFGPTSSAWRLLFAEIVSSLTDKSNEEIKVWLNFYSQFKWGN